MTDKRPHSRDRLQSFDKSVRVFGMRKQKFIEFEFSVGCTELTIELVMLYPAFKEFCDVNHVTEITSEPSIKAEFEKVSNGYQHTGNIINLGEFK